jgi:hypothetical protein
MKIVFVSVMMFLFSEFSFANDNLGNEKRKQLIINKLSSSLLQVKDIYKKRNIQVVIDCVKNSDNINNIKSCMTNTIL